MQFRAYAFWQSRHSAHRNITLHTQSTWALTTPFRWTHIAVFPPTADVRDGYVTGTPNSEGTAAGWDTVYVPDKNGTPFTVIFAEHRLPDWE